MLLSIGSTLVFAAVVWITIVNTPGWARVQKTFFDPEVFVSALPRVAEGFLLNLRVLFFAVIAVFIFSIVIALLRTLRGPVFFPVRSGGEASHRMTPVTMITNTASCTRWCGRVNMPMD